MAAKLADDVREATEKLAFECSSLGLYETAVSLMEAMQDDDAARIDQLSKDADKNINGIRGSDSDSAAEATAFRSLGGEFTALSAGDSPAAVQSGPHASASPADWTFDGKPELLQKILLFISASGISASGLTDGQPSLVFTVFPLVCKRWEQALSTPWNDTHRRYENNAAWRQAFFALLFGHIAWGSEIEKGHKNAMENNVQVNWREKYEAFAKKDRRIEKTFVLNYDPIATQAAQGGHTIRVVHVEYLIDHMCDIAEKVAVTAPIPVPPGLESCVTGRAILLAHKVFQIVVHPQQTRISTEVISAVTGIWEASITQTVDRISEKLQGFSVEHKTRACVLINNFIAKSRSWLAHYVDRCPEIWQLHLPLTCAQIGDREAQRLRTLLNVALPRVANP